MHGATGKIFLDLFETHPFILTDLGEVEFIDVTF
jgi:hypothetical protein